MSVFGWHYPPGAEFDPRAPWNEKEEPEEEEEEDEPDADDE